jgi:hypothetical protein
MEFIKIYRIYGNLWEKLGNWEIIKRFEYNLSKVLEI